MAKVALLIGVSEYEPGLNPLPAAVKDVEAMKRVLAHPEMGGFAEADITVLKNPQRQEIEEAIYRLFADSQKDDLLLFYFSGHGVKDESGKLYLSTRITRKDNGKLVKPSAVAASFLHESMNESKSQRQVVILDCCFSGAFAQGLTAKDDASVDLEEYLGGKGRAILTATTSTQYAFEEQDSELAVYTRYLVEGIEKGAADTDGDGWISVDELHEYASSKVQEAAPAMTPKFYPVEEGYRIRLAKSPKDDPRVRYRKEAERYASRGEISVVGRRILAALRNNLGLQPEETAAIETEVLQPYQEYRRKLEQYEQTLTVAVQQEFPLTEYTLNELRDLQKILALKDEDVAPIEAKIIPGRASTPTEGDAPQTKSVPVETKAAGTNERTISAVESNPTKKSTSKESITEDLRAKQRVDYTRPSASNPRSLFAKIAHARNKFLVVGTIILIGLAGFEIYRQTMQAKSGYERLKELLSGAKWKEADNETARKMVELAGRQKEGSLRGEDFKKINCGDLSYIDNLWVNYSKRHFGLSVQRHIWQSSDVNSDMGKFIMRVGWGWVETKPGVVTLVFADINNLTYDLSAPKGQLPVAVTYNSGRDNKARNEYISRIVECDIK
ncbi:caspase, EACC1-associated type [Microseira wollei]|uniref:EF-hand domain-containing protein n=1 Tax=Microseira wollei NIES-4236 TaxID=2530354 RepID=A0AAV3X9X0_9CYAN|nr:GUN4 domain-containing protein [Microseira wollei]GET37184.1 hypothetical protein MiSe_19370 [Microseira wollei NIES-4236]